MLSRMPQRHQPGAGIVAGSSRLTLVDLVNHRKPAAIAVAAASIAEELLCAAVTICHIDSMSHRRTVL